MSTDVTIKPGDLFEWGAGRDAPYGVALVISVSDTHMSYVSYEFGSSVIRVEDVTIENIDSLTSGRRPWWSWT